MELQDDAIQIINGYFENDMTPGLAYKEYVKNLRNFYPGDLTRYHKALANRSICPRRRDFNKLYAEFNLDRFGGSNTEKMLEIREKNIREAKEKYPGIINLYNETSSLLVAIVTPLMDRTHMHIKESAEIAFVDSSSNI